MIDTPSTIAASLIFTTFNFRLPILSLTYPIRFFPQDRGY